MNDIFYAHKEQVRDEGKYFMHIYPNPTTLRVCFPKTEPIYKVKVRQAKEDEKSPYWGWYSNGTGLHDKEEISMIYPRKFLVEGCSPDGFRTSMERGEGEIINLVIEELATLPPGEI